MSVEVAKPAVQVDAPAAGLKSYSTNSSIVKAMPELSEAKTPFDAATSNTLYHVYHQGEWHYLLTPRRIDKLEKRNPKRGKKGKKGKKKGVVGGGGEVEKADAKKEKEEAEDEDPASSTTIDAAEESQPDSFFVFRPYVSFHHPPRVLRRGGTKSSTPICLIYNSAFWRRWKLQFGGALSSPGVIDPRGVVDARHSGDVRASDTALKGYKVRSWRLWGESGKAYHREVNALRKQEKAGTVPTATVGDGGTASPATGPPEKTDFRLSTSSAAAASLDGTAAAAGPAEADQALYLTWASPFSKHTRLYTFAYAGVEFCWKGTGTVAAKSRLAMFAHFNHLKLVARVPLPADDDNSAGGDPAAAPLVAAPAAGICLAKYTSSLLPKKSGELQFFDAAILRFMAEHVRDELPDADAATTTTGSAGEDAAGADAGGAVEEGGRGEGESEEQRLRRALKRTRFYEVLVATGVSMIIGEFQKRQTLKEVLENVGEGG